LPSADDDGLVRTDHHFTRAARGRLPARRWCSAHRPTVPRPRELGYGLRTRMAYSRPLSASTYSARRVRNAVGEHRPQGCRPVEWFGTVTQTLWPGRSSEGEGSANKQAKRRVIGPPTLRTNQPEILHERSRQR
jgi:hypothetical protein